MYDEFWRNLIYMDGLRGRIPSFTCGIEITEDISLQSTGAAVKASMMYRYKE